MTASDQQIIDKLVTARIALLLKHPFFGNLASRLKLVNANDWCPTAGTDGRHFYYNTKFIDSLTPREAEFLFGLGFDIFTFLISSLATMLIRKKLRTARQKARFSAIAARYI